MIPSMQVSHPHYGVLSVLEISYESNYILCEKSGEPLYEFKLDEVQLIEEVNHA